MEEFPYDSGPPRSSGGVRTVGGPKGEPSPMLPLMTALPPGEQSRPPAYSAALHLQFSDGRLGPVDIAQALFKFQRIHRELVAVPT